MTAERSVAALVFGVGERRPVVDEAAWIAPTAAVIGSVELGRDVSIWYGASLRADAEEIRIGSGTNIQDNCVVHTDPGMPVSIGNHVTVGHGAILHGCRIEDGVLVGMGAVIMNGAVIGAGSLIAAGTVITEETVVPAGSLIAGVPGKIKRALDADAIAANGGNAHHYVELAAEHRRALEAVR
ncbi:gamma carbonic anhydrase family protein [Rhodococcoides fascians A21d2]|uniref:gamma carbonic anhydrase family protein n=1 Tax=Rhodococcoides fascians TaxID=1828 RepID=UPI00056A2025|nr:gamma carbonic anhydrase family protein [Rhodococcus fascians]QII00338.1 gamma carbonic anhydrase family protein [Rhodococcus fascians A21d2]